MPPALELVGEERGDDLPGHEGTHHGGADGQHVGIVVPPGHLGAPRLAAQGAADAPDLVGRDGRADAGGAHHDAPLSLSLRHSPAGRLNEVRVVAAVGGVGAEIGDLMALFGEPRLDLVFQLQCAVVRCHCDFHSSLPSLSHYFFGFFPKKPFLSS